MSTICGPTARATPRHELSFWRIASAALLIALDAGAQPVVIGGDASLENLTALTPQALMAAIEASNPDLQSVAAAAEAAAFRIEPAGALADPMFTYGIAPNSIGSDIGVRHIGQFSQPIPWPGKRDLRRTMAAQRADAAAEDVAITRLQLFATANMSFAEWHYLHRAIEVNAATQALLAELAAVAETRYAAGRALQQEVLQIEVETVLLQERQLALEHDRISLRASINALVNREPTDPLPPPAPIDPPDSLPDIEQLRQSAEINHPEIRRIQARVGAASTQVELADKAGLPDFSANVGYVGTLDPADKRMQVGVSINIPLNRDKRRAELGAANADLRRDRYALAAQRLEILAALESAYTHTHHAIDVIRLYEERLLELVQNNLDAALADYRSGTGQFINVVTAERQLLETEQSYERARADYWRMRAELERAAGGTLPDARSAAARPAPALPVAVPPAAALLATVSFSFMRTRTGEDHE
jgi:cobalt-zinc-cadmium efflux system outer membrane protein